MSPQNAWCSASIFVLAFYTLPKPSQNQVCSTEKMENITIDIKAAFSSGIQGEDPIHASSWEACVDVCCLGAAESKKCNYVVFNTRSKGNYTNCYLFYYPTNKTCPTRQVPGLVTYRMIKDAKGPTPTPSSVPLSYPTAKSASALVALFNPHIPTSPLHGSGSLQKPVPPKRVEILNHLDDDKHMDESDGPSQPPQGRRANGSKSLGPSTIPELQSLLSPRTPDAIEPGTITVQPAVKSPTITSGTWASTMIPHVSPRNAITTRSTRAYHKNTPWATIDLRRTTTVPNPSTNAGSRIHSVNPLLVEISSASLPDVHLGSGQPGLKGDALNGDSSKERSPPFGDKGLLTAALLLGVIFFLLVTLLVGRRLFESAQRRRYTKLDYLINGMYANM